MITITALIIAKNEETLIEECIGSVSFCNEIIVIDNESTDNTAKRAKAKGAVVIPHAFFHFAKARNFALQQAKSDWVFYIDADERVDIELKKNIQQTIVSNPEYSAFTVERKNYYLGKNAWPTTERLERLFKKNSLKEWFGELHETPRIEGHVGSLDGLLHHYTHRTLSGMLQKTIEWSKVEAKLRYEAKHPPMVWWRFFRVMIPTFYDWYIRQKGWKLGTVGLIESLYQTFSIYITYARLWEMQHSKK